MGKRLKGYAVLVTRPKDQAAGLCAAIAAEGGSPILAPMIAIRAISDPKRSGAVIDRIEDYGSAIFVSRNAVEFGIEQIRKHDKALAGQTIYAVGVGTAACLREQGVTDVATPHHEFTSEGLLKLDGLQAHEVRGAKILIFRGGGGREHLAQTLGNRGATVDYCEVYERFVPDICVADTLSEADISVPDIGVITSLDSLTNFVDKIDEEGLDLLFDMPLLVVGSRIANEVEKLGFTNAPRIVDNPNDDNVVDTLARWVMDEI